MKLAKKIGTFIKDNKVIVGIIGAVIIAALLFLNKGSSEPELFTLQSENLSSTGVTVGGTVVAQKEVDLSFEMSGRISSVNKSAGEKVIQGQVIAQLDTGTISANILKAEADLDAEIAKLEELKENEGLDSQDLVSKKAQLVRELKNAFVISEDAVRNKTDQFFRDPTTRFPEIFGLQNNVALRNGANDARYQIGLTLNEWSDFSNNFSTNNYEDSDVQQTKSYIKKVQDYLNQVAFVVNKFEATNDYPQSTIDKYKTDTTTARTNLNGALANIISAEEAARRSTSQVPFQEARVKSARATVQNYRAELQKGRIVAPFTGVITRQDAKVGMSVSTGQEIISMISDSNYGIDTFVPEVYIAQIKLGNKAQVSLNSYGAGEYFDAVVTYIDPAASQRDGVASYKVELVFDKNDERIKSGMTADVEILTEAINPAFWIPNNTVIDQGGLTYVKVKSGESTELRKVEVGERNPSEIEILSGLIVGDQIIINSQK